jgi:hypothetical protein
MTWLTDLERLAREATPGPWKVEVGEYPEGGANGYYHVCQEGGEGSLADCYNYTTAQDEANARYIAALTPARLLALIEVAKAAGASVDNTSWAGVCDEDCILQDALRALRETP